MALDPNIQKSISVFIQGQFPRLYEEFGQPLIDFVTAYYLWMETQGPLFDARRASEYQDIDTTANKFIVFFKDKYLPNIQLETKSNVDLLVKHSLDVYRSRGTIRSIDLLFRLVFGVGAQVYYPFDDVFQPSSGDWFVPTYLEVSTRDDLNKFVGKEVVGFNSGARAFVESWIRKKAGSKQIDILYISALQGNFTLNERINVANNQFPLVSCPSIIGSLTDISILNGGISFNVGDVLNLVGTHGYGGVGRVAEISQTTGTISFGLTDGGYGYTANAAVLISDTVLSLSNVVAGNTSSQNFFSLFETVSQPLANINYQAAVGGHFANNDTIFTYNGNGVVLGTGKVLASTNGNSTNGQIFVAVLSGNLQSNAIYNTSNVVSANVPVANGYSNRTATGNVISETLNATIIFDNIVGSFFKGEIITTGSPVATASLDSVAVSGATGIGQISSRAGVWAPGANVIGSLSGTTATLISLNMGVGLKNLTNSFVPDTRAPIISLTSNTTGVLPILNQGSGASFQISPILLFPETVSLNTDLILPYAGVALNSGHYGFPAFPNANTATLLSVALATVSYTIGKISSLVALAPGSGYTVPPLVRVWEPITFSQAKIDNELVTITGASGSFAQGELITQAATSARGLVISSNSTSLILQKLSLFNAMIPTINSTTTIISTNTGSSANVVSVEDQVIIDSEDIAQTYIGFNAVVGSNTSAANGTVADIQILDSGWGYEPGETITFSENGITGTGQAVLLNQGIGAGFYRTEDGFVSDIKKIHDNDYYQVSSYDVRASVAFEHYRDMLKALLHVAGTKAFGTFVFRTAANVPLNIRKAKVTQA